MIEIDHNEAILFRLLTGFFGKDRVIPNMSLLAVCSGDVPPGDYPGFDKASLRGWAKSHKCLFTIVNGEDAPCMVIEFAPGIRDIVDLEDLSRRKVMRPLLKAAGISYLTMDARELALLTDPSDPVDFFHFLEDKVEHV